MITSSTWSHSTLHTHIEMVCSSYSFFNYISTKTKRTLFSTHPWNCWLCHSWQYCDWIIQTAQPESCNPCPACCCVYLKPLSCSSRCLQGSSNILPVVGNWQEAPQLQLGHQPHRQSPPANTRFYNGLWRTHTRASNQPPRSLKLYKLRILSCALVKGLASMILNRDSYCDDTDNQMLSLNDVMM